MVLRCSCLLIQQVHPPHSMSFVSRQTFIFVIYATIKMHFTRTYSKNIQTQLYMYVYDIHICYIYEYCFLTRRTTVHHNLNADVTFAAFKAFRFTSKYISVMFYYIIYIQVLLYIWASKFVCLHLNSCWYL